MQHSSVLLFSLQLCMGALSHRHPGCWLMLERSTRLCPQSLQHWGGSLACCLPPRHHQAVCWSRGSIMAERRPFPPVSSAT
uniref:Secreted protein n=1 Tax=Rhipicephalus appendiculatus TaxID=34631 RepID=A0A131YFI0_RHIAP